MKWVVPQSMLVVISLCSMASACPMCRDSTAVNNGGAGTPPVALFNASVLCMLGVFLVIAGLLAAKIVGAIRLVDRSGVEQNGTKWTKWNTVFLSHVRQ
jgi:hypothetical protein